MSVPLKGFSNYVGTIASGTYQNTHGVILDLSGSLNGAGVDLSNTAIIKIAPFDNNNSSLYALLDLSRNVVNNLDCSGANIIRILDGTVLPVGYISNPGNVNAFVCDTSGNLWVGGNSMAVKTNNYGSDVSNAESMFIIPRIGTVQPTAFNHVDVSGCNDICPVENLMVASVVDVSGRCLNYVSSGNANTLTIGSVVLPRINGNTGAFQMTISPGSGGVALDDTDMDLSGHRLVAFKRTGDYGNDISGFYVIRSNSSASVAASTNLGNVANTSISNINYILALNKIAYDSDRNKLYVVRNTDDTYPIIIPLDVSANTYTSNYQVKTDALLKYAKPTSSTAGAVDGSGFMVVCTNPSAQGEQPVIKLDASGSAFDTLTVTDVSGVVAMDTVVASYNGSNYNYIFLVDASRNVVATQDDSKNVKTKMAEIWLSARSENTGNYYDGSGVTFIHGGNSLFNYDVSGAYIRDLRIDACGNIFIAGHQLFIQNEPTIQNKNIQSITNLNIMSSSLLNVATSNLPLIGNPLSYEASIALTGEKEPSEINKNFINNRNPNTNVQNILNSNPIGQMHNLMNVRL